MHAERWVDHGVGAGAHAAGADRVIDRIGTGADMSGQIGVAYGACNVVQFRFAERRESGGFEHGKHLAHALKERRKVALIREKTRVDPGLIARIAACKGHCATCVGRRTQTWQE